MKMFKSGQAKNVMGEFTHHVLERMSVNADEANGGGPLVVLLVVMLVEARMMEQPERKEEEEEDQNNDNLHLGIRRFSHYPTS